MNNKTNTPCLEKPKRALLSVFDKTGIIEFAKELELLGYEIVSTGGTLSTLRHAGVNAVNISDITSFKECLDGRVKTLHPVVHAGILAMRDNPEHINCLKELDIAPIDVVAVNLYPFKATIQKEGVELSEVIENIDIGGPTMLRSAAKNYRDVYVVCDASDYQRVIAELKSNTPSIDTKFQLMYKVFQHTATYDTLIATYMRSKLDIQFPDSITWAFEKKQEMRYGENPSQKAAFYAECFPIPGSLVSATQLQGKELSFNNINDADGALNILREFSAPTAVALKHANPCGVGSSDNIYDAYISAFNSDPTSIFGGIVALNREVDKALALKLTETFLEIVIAPDFTQEALSIYSTKKNVRLLKLPSINAKVDPNTYDIKKVLGGVLLQNMDLCLYNLDELCVVTEAVPTPKQMEALEFAFKIVKHVKSNAIVIADDKRTLGIGMGQPNRIWATEHALAHAGINAKGAVLASDAFFPFQDCVNVAARYGISAIIQPGGSLRDKESIEACNKHGITMVFSNMRHFKH